EIKLRVPGIFNIYNAMAAATVALELGVNFKIIKKSLEDFKGIWRRFEIIGNHKGAILISDYAHHPTAIKETIMAAKEFYPNRRIVAVFQPHSHNRTRKLFSGFAKSFDEADLVILSEVYDVEGRENQKEKISSKELAKAARVIWNNRKDKSMPCFCGNNIFYAKDLKETEKILRKKIKKKDAVLIMGAGDIYKLKI
ncbi:MAG: cyanophycin synthetase, partial [bacterium]